MIRVARRCPAHTMKYATPLLGLAILIASVGTVTAQQDQFSGNYWLSRCEAAMARSPSSRPVETVESGFCMGVVDAWVVGRRFLKSEHTFCLPEKVSRDQAQRVVIKFLKDHPDMLNEPFVDLALFALVTTWPCRGLAK
jgi:Rap1a immunity proteins